MGGLQCLLPDAGRRPPGPVRFTEGLGLPVRLYPVARSDRLGYFSGSVPGPCGRLSEGHGRKLLPGSTEQLGVVASVCRGYRSGSWRGGSVGLPCLSEPAPTGHGGRTDLHDDGGKNRAALPARVVPFDPVRIRFHHLPCGRVLIATHSPLVGATPVVIPQAERKLPDHDDWKYRKKSLRKIS